MPDTYVCSRKRAFNIRKAGGGKKKTNTWRLKLKKDVKMTAGQ